MDIIRENFNDRDMRCILSISLKESNLKDEITWASSKNARNFLWRFCTETLPVRSLLKFRHLTEDALCPWCEREEETWKHAFFNCDRVKELWSELECSELLKFDKMDSACNLIESWRDIRAEKKVLGIYLMWGIWLDRNVRVFQGKSTPNSVLIARVQRWKEENEKYNKAIYSTPAVAPCSSSKVWIPPLPGWVKINSDASLTDEGWVARDNFGNVLLSACRRWKAWWQIEIAESKAIILALKLGKRFGYSRVIIETDCQIVTNRLSKGASHLTDLDAILCDAIRLGTTFEQVAWSHVRRGGERSGSQPCTFYSFQCRTNLGNKSSG
ncbi:uncharacterized protein LOC110727234 [Chenopodium quinoa]|uniref:uncharacterized protein LOC110727234 n=1 Tax=Chenopodium quinoa TaxID=63459 RepID=UPI000B788ECF|nr:uncharacterized protein LOC110727234 [Chenopodium quinoa]